MTADDKAVERIWNDLPHCPICGALPCDQVNQPAEQVSDDALRMREALRLIKLACLGTSEKDGWTALRILHCVTRICIDAGVREPYHELGTPERYRALFEPVAKIGNRVDAALTAANVQPLPDDVRRVVKLLRDPSRFAGPGTHLVIAEAADLLERYARKGDE